MLPAIGKYRLPVALVIVILLCFLMSDQKRERLHARISCLLCRMFPQRQQHHNLPNPHNFSYPINMEDICRKNEVDVIMPVSTAVYNFEKRQIFRNSTQARFAANKKNGLKILYFVGIPSKKLNLLDSATDFQKNLQNESAMYGDIIQVQLEETYLNLVYKSLAVMYWIETYCYNSTFVLRTDDDVDINAASAILALYRRQRSNLHFMMGERRDGAKPERRMDDKYYMSEKEYPGEEYPSYIAGPAMGYPTHTSVMLYREALKTKLIWIEDVLFGGIIRETLGIPAINDRNFATRAIHHKEQPKYFVYS